MLFLSENKLNSCAATDSKELKTGKNIFNIFFFWNSTSRTTNIYIANFITVHKYLFVFEWIFSYATLQIDGIKFEIWLLIILRKEIKKLNNLLSKRNRVTL